MVVLKITHGYVIQKMNVDKKGNVKFLSQEFVVGDDCIFENELGEEIDNDSAESAYMPYDMKQPDEIA
jgi:hypothetical protein